MKFLRVERLKVLKLCLKRILSTYPLHWFPIGIYTYNTCCVYAVYSTYIRKLYAVCRQVPVEGNIHFLFLLIAMSDQLTFECMKYNVIIIWKYIIKIYHDVIFCFFVLHYIETKKYIY